MKDYHINIFYSEEDEGYIADVPDLKFCSAFGETPEEALKEVLIAKAKCALLNCGSGWSCPSCCMHPSQASDTSRRWVVGRVICHWFRQTGRVKVG